MMTTTLFLPSNHFIYLPVRGGGGGAGAGAGGDVECESRQRRRRLPSLGTGEVYAISHDDVLYIMLATHVIV